MNLDEEFIRYEYISFSNTLGKDINIIDGDKVEEARVIGIAENIAANLLYKEEMYSSHSI